MSHTAQITAHFCKRLNVRLRENHAIGLAVLCHRTIRYQAVTKAKGLAMNVRNTHKWAVIWAVQLMWSLCHLARVKS
jgi:hypothetical protein